jgi:para-aminobenzoate synthetase component 1
MTILPADGGLGPAPAPRARPAAPGLVLVEHGPGGPAVFEGAREVIVAWTAAEVAPALARAVARSASGAWVAGLIAFEAGYALEPRLGPLMPVTGDPLVLLGAFDGPGRARSGAPSRPAIGAAPVASSNGAPRRMGRGVLAPFEPVIPRADYDRAIARVLDYIAAGDCYQVNLTFPLIAAWDGSPLDLHRALPRAGHGAFVDLGHGPAVVSRSPELFLRIDPGGVLTARPMKGTAPRDPDPARDAALAAALVASPKARAENLMIVDLLRNDIGRVAALGSVRVPDLFALETYPTVHQMTSTVEGRLREPPSLRGVMAALFPCGSVTGAPKIRAMEVIREVEPFARGAYCGAIGWMAPDGRADFSVAIRTLTVRGREVTLNVGGGIVADSTAQGEWEEALWKARFATLPPG